MGTRTPLLVTMSGVLAVLLVLSVVGCGPPAPEPLQPKVAPPVIGVAGTLRAGVDLAYPPFGGRDKEQYAGLDVDVASALAERLGLELQLVSVTASEAVSALESGTVDVVIAALPIDGAVLADVTFAGTYVNDGPVFFVTDSEADTPTLETLAGRTVGVQAGSESWWLLEDMVGEGAGTPFPSVREAFAALESGAIEVVVADGIVGAYIVRDFPTIRLAGQASAATPLGVAVKKDSVELETAVREVLDSLAADGVLEQIRSKWATPLPELEVPREQ